MLIVVAPQYTRIRLNRALYNPPPCWAWANAPDECEPLWHRCKTTENTVPEWNSKSNKASQRMGIFLVSLYYRVMTSAITGHHLLSAPKPAPQATCRKCRRHGGSVHGPARLLHFIFFITSGCSADCSNPSIYPFLNTVFVWKPFRYACSNHAFFSCSIRIIPTVESMPSSKYFM